MFDSNYYQYYRQPGISRFKKINFSKILDGTQRTLSLINQAIPIIYQIKPLYENTKTALKVMNSIKDEPVKKVNLTKNNEKKVEPSSNSPTYFL